MDQYLSGKAILATGKHLHGQGVFGGACSQLCSFRLRWRHTHSVWYRRASAPQVNENAECVLSVSASTASWQLPRVEYYSWLLVRKPLITKWHFRIRWQKKKKSPHRHWSSEIKERSDMITWVMWTSERCALRQQRRPECLTLRAVESCGRAILRGNSAFASGSCNGRRVDGTDGGTVHFQWRSVQIGFEDFDSFFLIKAILFEQKCSLV